jgi:hypothetical protein
LRYLVQVSNRRMMRRAGEAFGQPCFDRGSRAAHLVRQCVAHFVCNRRCLETATLGKKCVNPAETLGACSRAHLARLRSLQDVQLAYVAPNPRCSHFSTQLVAVHVSSRPSASAHAPVIWLHKATFPKSPLRNTTPSSQDASRREGTTQCAPAQLTCSGQWLTSLCIQRQLFARSERVKGKLS